MKGYKVHFKPGWDCHGLPIELKAVSSNVKLTPLQIRDKGNIDSVSKILFLCIECMVI